MQHLFKNLSLWLVIGLIGMLVVHLVKRGDEQVHMVSYTDLLARIDSRTLTDVRMHDSVLTWRESANGTFKSVVPAGTDVVSRLVKAGVRLEVQENKQPHWLVQSLMTWVPLVLLLLMWFFYNQRQSGPGGNKAFALGKSQARLVDGQKSTVRFKDVAGVDEAKEEVQEIVDFLKNPKKFTDAGAKIPAGVLLYGEPGTGKTLLAKAIAGEAGVPFFSVSGSGFVEMYVGIGASRVRDLFREGKKRAPCIIFIDEIDAVGRQRSAGGGGGNDEREQTLNQLLVEMDGFEPNDHVIVVAATNRQDMLDPALLRPGRFDRQVLVPLPDVGGREHILKVHGRKIRLAPDVDWRIIARATPGFSGAQLANMINEAALLVARRSEGEAVVNMEILEQAKDKVMMGAERRSLILTEQEKKVTAYHEAGHALVAWMLPAADPVHKVTIIPRGRALGVTMQLPLAERYAHARSGLRSTLCTLLGGREAEALIFDEITTGAGNDIERVSSLARKMVCEWGMSPEIGPMIFRPADPLNGVPGQILSEASALAIDQAVREVVLEAQQTAAAILREHRPILDAMAQALLERETITHDDIEALVKAHQPQPAATAA
ncbi:MAG: cell division protein FtsH [Desulfobulbaceae bacterium A2]|nr:MAG: cell division protein FtsH [Desulfobulbaceae bacterium A2]